MAFSFRRKKKSAADLDSFDIPSFSSSVISLLGKLRDPDIDINEIAVDLECDPGLYIRVLKTVNSASFGLSRKVSNIGHAANLLGRSRLESLVLSVAVKNNLSDGMAGGLNMKEFWRVASLRASVAKALALELHPHQQSDVFTIGLLQDMAIPLLSNRHGRDYQELYRCWQDGDDVNLAEQEEKLFGVDHMSLGAHMAETWGFPETLISAIGEHHDLENPEVPLAIRIAAFITSAPQEASIVQLAEQASKVFQLEQDRVEQVLERAFEESVELSAALE